MAFASQQAMKAPVAIYIGITARLSICLSVTWWYSDKM